MPTEYTEMKCQKTEAKVGLKQIFCDNQYSYQGPFY